MGEIDLLGCSPRIGYHWFVCMLSLQCLLVSDFLQQWYGCSYVRSLGGRTVPYYRDVVTTSAGGCWLFWSEKSPTLTFGIQSQGSHHSSMECACHVQRYTFAKVYTCQCEKFSTLIGFNPIPTGCCHVICMRGLIPPSAGRIKVNTVALQLSSN